MYKTLCAFEWLSEYRLKINETKLFISCVKPHKLVAKETISRWTRAAMEKAGIDITNSKPVTQHSNGGYNEG